MEFDIVIKGAKVVDGLGGPPVAADIAILGERIARIGDGAQWTARETIDAGGKVAAPGFIDCHTHDDRLLLSSPLMRPKVSQGVTTVITGNCGISLAPVSVAGDAIVPPLNLIAKQRGDLFGTMREYAAALADSPAAVNSAALVGHSSLRVSAMDRLDRPADKAEIAAMRRALDIALGHGAIGLSTGLYYPTAVHSSTEEVIGVAAPLARWNGVYTTHLRDEGDHICDAMEEAFTIGRAADVPAILSHHKVMGKHNHGRSTETLALYDKARRNQPLGMDLYPYAASSTVLDTRRLADSDKVLITWSEARPDVQGQDLFELARREGKDPVVLAGELQPAGAIYFSMDEGDVKRIMAYDQVMIGSDGLPHDTSPHPRLWGAFSRVLGKYSREQHVLGMEEAVRRMTSLTAAKFGLKDRGVLKAGCFADIVMFDPETVADAATFLSPLQPSVGIACVMVNGAVVERDGVPTGARPGRFLGNEDRGAPGLDVPAWA
ncbi:N-acyl-D-amino-acid deacylase family protein [Achromobacter aloeverae]